MADPCASYLPSPSIYTTIPISPQMPFRAVDPQELTVRIAQLATQSRHQPQSTEPPPLSSNSSPISSLPTELLIEVFKFAIPTERFPCPSPTTAPLSLVHVCRYWRQLAKAIPTLWSALHLNYRNAVEDILPTRIWLSLSGDEPLSISLSLDFDEKPHQAIINALVDHSERWKHVRFEFQNLQCPQMYDLAPAMDRVPMLSSFEFHARAMSNFNIEPISKLLVTAPNLKELTWVDDLADAETLHSLPLPQLSRLSLSMNYGRLDYLKLFNMCLNLEHVRISRPFPDIQPPQTPLLLAKLTSLNIAHDLTGILDNLILPSLKHFRVHMDAGVPENLNGRLSRALSEMPGTGQQCWDPTPLLNLVERSSCAIERLSICTPMFASGFSECLKVLSPSLKSLTISGWSTFNNTAIQALTPHKRMDPCSSLSSSEGGKGEIYSFCPFLVELKIDSIIPHSCSLVDMVQKRLELPLHSPHLPSPSTSSDLHPPQILPLKSLRAQYLTCHRDIPYLRELAAQANSRSKGSFQLSIVESRIGVARGSSAGRTRTLMFRQKTSESR